MSQQFLSSLSAALLLSTIGVMPSSSSYGSEVAEYDEGVEENVPLEPLLVSTSPASGTANQGAEGSVQDDPVKVGEYQSQRGVEDNPIAVIHSHVMDGRQAATVYVGGIPVLTLLGDDAIARAASADASETTVDRAETKVLKASGLTDGSNSSSIDTNGVKLPDQGELGFINKSSHHSGNRIQSSAEVAVSDGSRADSIGNAHAPVDMAMAIAARINQLQRDGIDATEIVAKWDNESETFVITAADAVLIEFDSDVMLPDTTGNVLDDVLQATNRIRRQLGAEPLNAIEGSPDTRGSVAVGPVELSFTGRASWYGPGFHGRRSASGEVFDQNALTAAHRTLPFGTIVRVTNVHNGASVTVRINDRGPFGGGRVLDLSTGAARAIGMIQAGVATVRADIVDSSDSMAP